jgi:hypothetical protein
MTQVRKKVVRMLALGGHADDRVLRLTQGEQYVCCHGSEKEHQQLSDFCEDVQRLVYSTGQTLEDFTTDELSNLLSGWMEREPMQ